MNPQPRKPKILVVDDEKGLLDVFSGLCRRSNYDMQFFSDPAKAIEAVALDPTAYSLAITDMCMPNLDGLTFAKTLRSLRPHMGIVFMSGHVTDEMKEATAKFPHMVLLEKPFPLDQLFKETIPKLLAS